MPATKTKKSKSAAAKKAARTRARNKAAKQRSHRPTLAKGGQYAERTCGRVCRVRLGNMVHVGEVRRRKTAGGHILEVTVIK